MKFGSRPVDISGDEVVACVNVYFSPSLKNQAHIFQYPLRRKQRPYEATEIRLFSTNGTTSNQGEVVPSKAQDRSVLNSNSRLTMKCSLDTFGSPSFKPASDESSDMMTQMDLQRQNTYSYTMQSQPFHPHSNYVLGYVTAEGIHLTPVSTIQQFAPALDVAGTTTGALRVAEAFCSQPNSNAVPSFAAAERIQRDLQRQRSSMLNQDAATGREIQVFRAASVESAAMRSRLRSSTLEQVSGSSGPHAAPAKVENSLFPPEILESGGITGGDESSPSMIIQRFANLNTVAEQTTQLLQRCHVITLPLLQGMIVPHTTNEVVKSMATVPEAQLVEALRGCAVWIHGVWVSRFCDQFRGSVAALREVILSRFYQSEDGSLTRTELNALVTSSAARRSIKEILITIAELNSAETDPKKRRWRLRYVSADCAVRDAAERAFHASFATEVANQQEAWKRRLPPVTSHLAYINAGRAPPQLFLQTRGAHSTGPAATLPSLASPVGAGAGGLSASSPSASPFGSPNVGGHDVSFKDIDLAPIRLYIRELFTEYGVINKLRVKDLVIRAQEARFPHATKAMLSAALQQTLEKFTDTTWVLKSVGEPLVDYYRPAILVAVLELRMFESSALMKRVMESVRERGLTSPPPSVAVTRASRGANPSAAPGLESVVQTVLAEVAEYKAGGRLWHIKGGNVMNA